MPYKKQLQALYEQIKPTTFYDFYQLKKALIKLQKQVKISDDEMSHLQARISLANEKYQQRVNLIPKQIDYPEMLPVTEYKQKIADLIQHNQVIIIAGETGSGKTTQIPKICLELGLGTRGLIGHTQPRRLAARAVANRIADELNTSLGNLVGYKVRFNDHISDQTVIKLMTDGILLAEIQNDRLLTQYNTIIIDEAHERSLNIDFILGYIKKILPKRPDLKVIITSATIDVQRFSDHFNQAPIIEVSGRTYPVEVRYRPVTDNIDDSEDDNSDMFTSIADAVDELSHEDHGDILIFLTGEREIRDVSDYLNKRQLRHTEILPLYARLSNAEQNQIFKSHAGRRIVLATNVAETSLTVPGIKYVIDTGMVRISRYSYRTKVQRLPIEPISQASANQRKGRCGRTSDGICIRLYDEQDYLSRPEFTQPEILRTNLASVILQMTALDLGDIAAFPFVEAPEHRHIKDGIGLLEELGAVYHKDQRYHLTKIGKDLAQLPIDPRLARMLVQSRQHGCVKEIMIIVAALSIQDPRERPLEKQQAADEKHQRFIDKESDFLTFIKLWHYIQEQQDNLSANQFRQLCRKDFLNYLRIREWQDVYTQIRQTVKQLNYAINSQEANYQSIHSAILSGLLSHLGIKDLEKFEYVGARSIKFSLFPNSALFKSPPKWCVVNELVETTKLWGRIVAKIEPEWVESLAKHLSKVSYHEPRWSKKQGAVIANEKVTLYGLPIVASRVVNYTQIDPVLCRELFIRHALVEGEWQGTYPFWQHNQQLIEEIENLEHKSRRRDILIDDEILFQFYAEHVDHSVISCAHFDRWWQQTQIKQPHLLDLTEKILINPNSQMVSKHDFPDQWQYGDIKLNLSYQFDIGQSEDGVAVYIPLPILNQIDESPFQWQVPGLRKELIIALIKSLPKPIRRNFVPAPNYADAFLGRVKPYQTNLLLSLETEFRKMSGVTITREDWLLDEIPEHLKFTYVIEDDKQQVVATGKDLLQIKNQLKEQVQKALSQSTKQRHHELEKQHLTEWNFGELPLVCEKKQHNFTIKAYPTLIDDKQSVSIQLVESKIMQAKLMRQGLRRLILLNIPSPIKYLHEKLPNRAKLGLYFNPFGHVIDVIDDCIACGIDYLISDYAQSILNQADFLQLLSRIKIEINETIVNIANQVEKILTLHFQINKKLKGKIDFKMALSLADIKKQLSSLIYKGFITDTTYQHLPDVYRYLQAIEKRIEKLYIDPNKDRTALIKIELVQDRYQFLLNNPGRFQDKEPEIAKIKWMIEELRVNLFAQQMGTPYPISEKRIIQYIEQIETDENLKK